MAVTLRYAKIVDRRHLQESGGLSPAVDNVVELGDPAPATARDFLVLRAWDDVEGGFEEHWRLENAHGQVVYRGTPRTVRAGDGDLYDEVRGVRFEYPAEDYQLVLGIDDRDVARTDFDVVVADDRDAVADTGVPVPGRGAGAGAGTGADERGAVPADAGLSDDEQAVLVAATELETGDQPGFAREVARRAGIGLEAARTALSRLSGPLDLLQEVGTGAGDDPDLGPRYRVKARP